MGTIIDLAAKLIEISIQLVGKDKTRELIDKSTVEQADLAADIAEMIKFGKTSSSG